VYRLLPLPDGRRAFTALADGTGLVWDLAPALLPAAAAGQAPSEKDMGGWWADLAGDDVGRAYAAVWRLAEAPGAVTPFLRRHLRPATDAEYRESKGLIEQLDSDSFENREKAFARLSGLGGQAVAAMRRALEQTPSPEVKRRLEDLLSRKRPRVTAEQARRLRAVQVLERIGSDDARAFLAELARGAASAPETEDAKAALDRLARRP
jgi:hypothetical protein